MISLRSNSETTPICDICSWVFTMILFNRIGCEEVTTNEKKGMETSDQSEA